MGPLILDVILTTMMRVKNKYTIDAKDKTETITQYISLKVWVNSFVVWIICWFSE